MNNSRESYNFASHLPFGFHSSLGKFQFLCKFISYIVTVLNPVLFPICYPGLKYLF